MKNQKNQIGKELKGSINNVKTIVGHFGGIFGNSIGQKNATMKSFVKVPNLRMSSIGEKSKKDQNGL